MAAALLDDPDGRHYGYQTAIRANIATNVVYAALARMEAAGWLISYEQQRHERVGPGRPRRYYVLTALGRARCADLVRDPHRSPAA